MSSTYTTRLRLTKQGDGDNAGTWGQIVNTVLDLIDDAVGGVSELTMTGSGSVDLTTSVANGASDEARKAVLRFIGVPTANRAVKVPSVEKVYFVHSSVSISADSYHIVIYPDGVSVCAGVTIKPNEKAIVYCDGTNLINLFSNVSALDPSNNLSDLTNVSAALVNLGFTASIGELNILDGATVTVGELNLLDGLTASAGELNILDGATVTVGEINYLDGVTSSIQDQLDQLTSAVGNALTSTNLGISNYYESSLTNWTAASITTFTHGLSVMPNIVVLEAVFTTAAGGFSSGDVIELAPHTEPSGTTSNYGISLLKSATEIKFQTAPLGFRVARAGTSPYAVLSGVTQIRVKAWAATSA